MTWVSQTYSRTCCFKRTYHARGCKLRVLKRSFAALHFLARTKAIACEACLATERFMIR